MKWPSRRSPRVYFFCWTLVLSVTRQFVRQFAQLTNQSVSYAFTSSPFSFHARHILPTSKFQRSYSFILLIFYRPVNSMCEWVWIQFTGLMLMLHLRVTPMNNPITLISTVQSLGYIFCRWQYMRSSANFRTVFSESQKPTHWIPSSDQILTQNDHSRLPEEKASNQWTVFTFHTHSSHKCCSFVCRK